jgi:hypothetical protein
MSILTYLRLGGLLAIVLALAGNYFYVRHLQHKVASQQATIDSQESKLNVLFLNQQETMKVLNSLTKIRERQAREKAIIHQTISTPDRFVDFTRRYRVSPDAETNNATNGKRANSLESKTKPKTIPATDR